MRPGGELHGGGVSGRSGIRLRLPQVEDLTSSSSVVTALVSTLLSAPGESAGIHKRNDGRCLRTPAQ